MDADVIVVPHGQDFELRANQWVPQPAERVFPFFADPYNLERLTPAFLGFHVRSVSTAAIGEGTLLRYRLRIHGLPVVWRTRIEEWQPPHRFVDMQLFGPYAAWRHTHEFIPERGGTRLRDVVRYRLRCAALQNTPLLAWVHRDVREIFAFRHRTIDALFAASPNVEPGVHSSP